MGLSTGGSSSVTVNLYQGGGTGGPLLASVNYTLGGFPDGGRTVPFSTSPLVTAGQVYTMSVGGTANLQASYFDNDVYPGGAGFRGI